MLKFLKVSFEHKSLIENKKKSILHFRIIILKYNFRIDEIDYCAAWYNGRNSV